MSWWKVFKSRVAGKVPSVNQLDLDSIGINSADGKMFIKKNSGGVESIVEIGGGGGGVSHDRAHQISSAADHPAVAEGDRNKLVATNAVTGAIELIDKPATPTNYWQRTGTTLTPSISGDSVYVETNESKVYPIYGKTADGNVSAIFGENENGDGVFGYGYRGVHGYSDVADGFAGFFNVGHADAIPLYLTSWSGINFLQTLSSISNSVHQVARKIIRQKTGGDNVPLYIKDEILIQGINTSDIENTIEFEYGLINCNDAKETGEYRIKIRNLGGDPTEVFKLQASGVLDVKTGFSVDGTAAVADGTYTVGKGARQDGTITVKGGIITGIQQAAD